MDQKINDELDPDLQELWAQLVRLHHARRAQTHNRYNRLNPFTEDLFDWKERGEYLFGKGHNITVYNTTIINGDVQIGDDTWVGPYVSLDGTAGIRIGSFCTIGVGCQIATHDTVKWALSGGKKAKDSAPISIGDCCFVGVHAIILKGVSIGNRCLIAAGAVVNKSVPDYSIVAGSPAKIIGKVIVSDDGEITLKINPSPPQNTL